MFRNMFLGVLYLSMATLAYAQDAAVVKSTIDDQKSVEVTVYNNNIALVKDIRQIALPTGQGQLRFMDVAADIMPTTVSVKSLNHTDGLSILEQDYEYDLLSPQKLLDKYVGKNIKIIDHNPYTDKTETLDATLLSDNGGEVYKIGDDIYLGHDGYKVLPQLPENLIAKPTLTWMFDNKTRDAHQVEVAYLTSNMNWSADYVLSISSDDKKADLSGWVTLDNTSGASYSNAKLKLIAGNVNMVSQSPRMEMAAMKSMAEDSAGAPQFQEKSFFEYHIYDLERKTDIKDNQTKQISLLNAGGINIEKQYIVNDSYSNYWFYAYPGDNPENNKEPVNVYMSFKNSKDNHMGMPLPAGTMRLYKNDSDGSQQFIGEDSIDHTPKDETLKLKIGEAFDITATRVQKDYQVIASNVYESEWEVRIKNHKDENVTVSVVEPISTNATVLSSSQDQQRIDASNVKFDVPVEANKEAVLTYRIRVVR